MSTHEAAAQTSIRRHLLATAGAAFVLIAGFGTMSATTELSGAVIATGALVVESSVKKVQHPTGGVVEQILVKDGAHVEAGDLLVRLDKTTPQANFDAITMELWEQSARQARLEAQRDGKETIAFADDLLDAAGAPEVSRIVNGETRLFELQREALSGQKEQLRERVAQLNNQISGLTEQITAKDAEIDLIQKELIGVHELWDKNLVPITRVTALERDAARLHGERGALVASIAESKEKIAETQLQIIQLDENLRSDVGKQLAEIRGKTSDLKQHQITARDQLERIEIRAPQNGTVHQLSVHAKGAVIGAGEQVMLIVPDSDSLVAEVRVAPRDIDQVAPRQGATLRFPTFNQRTTPEINGTVKLVAADVTENERTGNPYYVVRVGIAPEEIARLRGMRLIPGMPVDVFIRTSERTMLSYLLKPLDDQVRRAFREK
jgi:HlyD family secretion protein